MRVVKWVFVLAVMLVALVGCGQQGGQQEGQGGEGSEKGLVPREEINIEFVTHASPDPFWSVVQNGVNQAAEDMGVEVNYRELDSYDIPQLQRNLEAAIAAEPDGMVVSIPDPDALNDKIREATESGIPVVVINAGENDWRDVGALTYVGQTEYDAGVAAGERMAQAGVQSAICINHEQGNITLDQRCNGFEKGLGGQVKQVAVQPDPTAARNGIKTALRQNPDVDGLLTLNPGIADQALRALEESGRSGDVTFATFDLSPSVLRAVSRGEMLFATDQQQWLQGYLPIVLLTNYIQYGVRPVNTEIPTGPAFITKENAEQVIELSRQGIR
ncbi:periplasmic binding protein/LacI transcriptional regulator [Rubrobacter xylanophilus DSM 9941]|uniref:Periplasmic binding protein/LacI transcriptional regulator n=1 Tax=Rubrobacter xylanophilus (strain DSM 9941 / JCM 11954 / NBRC 16129 / PRD-1) TaxID=266117 RepID=Q1AV97_RUBXD|nr:sugar ABC transporter substrate-binding protein [Rubrobacter xylanophilus]ABG04681.1 periplasmic binding protein/LacI transcriptional regulator [Rubrobacter xylanophilus DSM 9941]